MYPEKIKIYFDGSCISVNPGGTAGFGWLILNESDEQLETRSGVICEGPEATNNVAEWGSLLDALRHLEDTGWNGELEIFGDSQLVIRQLKGEYKCRAANLQPYYIEALDLLENWEWSSNWIGRNDNKEADALSKACKNGRDQTG
jgi:ribonuclease HI